MNETKRETELLDRYADDLARDPRAPSPAGLDAEAATPDDAVRARVWQRALDGAQVVPKQRRVRYWLGQRLGRRPIRLAGVVVMILLVIGTALWASPPARAQLERFACLVPGVGIRGCEAPGLTAVEPVAVSRDGVTLTVTSLLSSDGRTVVRVEIAGVPLAAVTNDSFNSLVGSAELSLRDTTGKTYPFGPRNPRARGIVPQGPATPGVERSTFTFGMESAFGALDPNVRAVDVQVEAPAPVGVWQVRVPVVPLQEAGLPSARGGGSGVTLHGITMRVDSVAADRQGIAARVVAQTDPAVQIVRNLARERYGRRLVLRDNQGREYIERPPAVDRDAPGQDGVYTDDVLFSSLPADVHTATLTVPFVTVEEVGAVATLRVPLADKRASGRVPFEADLALGQHRFRVTHVEFARDNKGEPRLWLFLDLGDWSGGRKLVQPGRMEVNGDDRVWRGSSECSADVGQCARIAVALPPGAGDEVTITFHNPVVAIQGPWQLDVPLPGSR